MKSRLLALLCLSTLQPTIRSSMSGDTLQPTICCVLLWLAILRTPDCPLCSTCRYCCRLSYVLYSVWRYTTPDYPMCSTLSVDSTTDYPIYRLCALVCMEDSTNDYLLCCTLSHETTTDYLRYSTISGVTTTDYPLCSTCRYYKRLPALPIIRYAGVLHFYPWHLVPAIWIGCRINWNRVEARLNLESIAPMDIHQFMSTCESEVDQLNG
jgi:hypothetical protein